MIFPRLKARIASWYINNHTKNRYVYKTELSCISSFVALCFGFAYCEINPYSYAFRTPNGVFVYSRCNGRIYYFRNN